MRCVAALTILCVVAGAALFATPTGATYIDRLFPSANSQPHCYKAYPQRGLTNVCLADSATHTVYLDNLGAMQTPTVNTLTLTYNRTELHILHESPKYSGRWETDVIYRLGDLPGDLAGAAGCNDPGGDGSKGVPEDECDQFYVYYDEAHINRHVTDFGVPHASARMHVACHETGHTVGLLHPESAGLVPQPPGREDFKCMRSDFGVRESWEQIWLGPQNVWALNSWYEIW